MKKTFFVLTAALCMLLAGCGSVAQSITDRIESTKDAGGYSYTAEADTESVTEDELGKHETVSEITTDDVGKSQEGLFYYDSLDSNDRLIYAQILYILQGLMQDVIVSTMDEDQLARVFECVMNDHPELFYVEGYNYTKYSVADIPQKMTFSGNYTMTREEVNAHVDRINEYINNFSEALKNGVDNADDYNIIKFVYEYIILGTEYDMSSEHNQNIVSVMENGRSVCSGYSKTAQLLLNNCGIKTTIVLGNVKQGEAHSWNLVLADGKYYFMDVTWGDSSYSLRNDAEEFANSLPPVNYNYMLMTTEQLLTGHTPDNPDILPLCESMEDNYFVKEGLYFTSVDEQMLWQAFNNAYVREKEYIMIRMDNRPCYDEMRKYLLQDQKIFDYILTRDGSVSYAENADQLYMIFWL